MLRVNSGVRYQIFLAEIRMGYHVGDLIAVVLANRSAEIVNELAEFSLEGKAMVRCAMQYDRLTCVSLRMPTKQITADERCWQYNGRCRLGTGMS